PLTLRRVDAMQQGGQLPAAVRAMFIAPKGEVQVVPAEGNQGFYLVRVENIETTAGPDAEMLKSATRQEILGSAAAEVTAAFGHAVRQSVGVKINESALAQARNQLVSG